MKYLLVLLSSAAIAQTTIRPYISWYDSRTMPGESYLIIDNCFVPVKSKKISDLCYIQKEIEKQCGVKYELIEEKYCGKK